MTVELHDAWAAGLIDGDGCIALKKRNKSKKEGATQYYQLYVAVSQSSVAKPDVLVELVRLYGGGIYGPFKDARSNRLPRWDWQIVSADAERLLHRVAPFLIGKKSQAMIALNYRATSMGRGKASQAEQVYLVLRSFKNYTKARV